jgi:hypothetical protein
MTTRDIADKLIKIYREGKHLEAVEELYADKIQKKEITGYPGEITVSDFLLSQKTLQFKNQYFYGIDD